MYIYNYFLFYVHEFLPTCMCVHYICALRDQKSDLVATLKLELLMVMRGHMCAGNQTWVHCKSSKCS